MILRPRKMSRHGKWTGYGGTKYIVSLEYRPRLDMWDVVSLDKRHHGDRHSYMYLQTERFCSQLEALVFILKTFSDGVVELVDRYTGESVVYTKKEFEMLEKAVSTVTLIFGKDSRLVTDDQIFAHIKQLEDEVRSLNSINNKPKKLEAKVSSMKADIAALVQVVDNR